MSSSVTVRDRGMALRTASAASPLGSSTTSAQSSRRRSAWALATRKRRLPLVHGADDGGVLAAQGRRDRDGAVLVAQQAARRGALDPGRRRRERHGAPQAWQRGELGCRQAPEARELHRPVETARRALHPQTPAATAAAREQARRPHAQRARDRARAGAVACEHERQRPPQRPDPLLRRGAEVLDRPRSGAHHDPKRRRGAGGGHRPEQPLDAAGSLLELLARPRRPAPTQRHRGRRQRDLTAQHAQARMRIADPHRRLHLPLQSRRAEHREPHHGRPTRPHIQMHLQHDRPPHPHQPMQRPKHPRQSHRISPIVPIGLDQQPHERRPPPARAPRRPQARRRRQP